MAKFTLMQLQYFCYVAETGSFARAAELAHVSGTAVAASMKALEAVTGTQLCVRRRPLGVELTTSGQWLYVQARQLLAAADEVELQVAGDRLGLVGPLNVGCYPTFAPLIIPTIAEEFASRHPGVVLNFTIGSQESLIEELRRGRLDCAIIYERYFPSDLEFEEIYRNHVHVLLSADHPLAGSERISLAELRDEPLILFESNPSTSHTLEVLEAAGVRSHIRFRTTELELVRALVARGLGYSLMVHRDEIEESYEGRGFVRVALDPPAPPELVVVAWNPQIQLSSRTSELIAVARAANFGRPIRSVAMRR